MMLLVGGFIALLYYSARQKGGACLERQDYAALRPILQNPALHSLCYLLTRLFRIEEQALLPIHINFRLASWRIAAIVETQGT